MEQEELNLEQQSNKFESLHKVTPFSKYLAIALFVALPFIGGWVGYTFAPEKVVEVEKNLETMQQSVNNSNVTTSEQDVHKTVPESYGSDSLIDISTTTSDGKNNEQADDTFRNLPTSVDHYFYRQTLFDDEYYLIRSQAEDFALTTSLYRSTSSSGVAEILQGNDLPEEYRIFSLRSVSNDKEVLALNYHPGCFNCGTDTYKPWLLVVLNDDYKSSSYGSNRILDIHELGVIGQFEWTGNRTYRYAYLPTEGHPEYRYLELDRDTGVSCGMRRCVPENIDWDAVGWNYGEL